ncbi:cold-shock protein [Halococcus morrhuae DSM 1307]|uniref:cold-shock protein n=1 Tax=Halococcus morrhuae TaxID=2250 RepID=UPI001EF9DAF0|nr:cold shock domain-containing protein [Halococcus morrhuae]
MSHVNAASQSGFIETEATAKDVLFLPNAVRDHLPELGEEVTFEMVETRTGPRAAKLSRT